MSLERMMFRAYLEKQMADIAAKDQKDKGGCLTFFILVPLAILTTFTWAFVYRKVWAWFGAPLLGLPTISYRQAVAAAALLGLVSWIIRGHRHQMPERPILFAFNVAITHPVVTLFCLWVVYLIAGMR